MGEKHEVFFISEMSEVAKATSESRELSELGTKVPSERKKRL
ncbi:hypothetical protein [Anaerococcus sp. Marseille-P9784]|nr:hypothetical protein [Anaerococcus sp. Marseille-P9784]